MNVGKRIKNEIVWLLWTKHLHVPTQIYGTEIALLNKKRCSGIYLQSEIKYFYTHQHLCFFFPTLQFYSCTQVDIQQNTSQEPSIDLTLTWGMLGSGKGGHGIWKVKVRSNTQLALHSGRIRRCRCQQRLLTGFFINYRQVFVNQGIEKFHYQLCVVWYLRLLKKQGI